MIPLGLFGHARRNSFKVGIMMAQVSEFSLIFVILAQQTGLVSNQIVSLITLTALITIAVSCYAIIYDDELFNFLHKYIKFFENGNKSKIERKLTYDIIQFGYNKGGAELIKTFKSLSRKKLIVVDYNPDVIEILERKKVNFMYGDATDVELIEELGIEQAQLVVSTITHFETNKFLIEYIQKINPSAVVIARADSADEAADLYNLGASYVMVPHFVGTEKLGHFIEHHGINKKDFEKHKARHLNQLRNNHELDNWTS